MDLDLKQGQATERASLTECYDYLPVAQFLDVEDGKACVASAREATPTRATSST